MRIICPTPVASYLSIKHLIWHPAALTTLTLKPCGQPTIDNMTDVIHEIDPDGDVILVLSDAGEPFAIWDTSAEEQPPLSSTSESSVVPTPPESFARLDPGRKRHESQTKDFSDCGQPVSDRDSVTPAPDEPPSTEREVKVRMRVSSKHLTLASPYFKKMLHGPWIESAISDSNKTIESEGDVAAMLILMNIIHGNVRSVPRSVKIEMLVKIAVLVDYYQCHEVTELFVETWIRDLERDVPGSYGRNLVLWLTVSCVFSQKSLLTRLAQVASRQSTTPLQTMGFPIPNHVAGQ